jgi:hypothetical protein
MPELKLHDFMSSRALLHCLSNKRTAQRLICCVIVDAGCS